MKLRLTLALLVAGLLVGVPPAQATFLGENGKIGFIGGGGISSINLDGTGNTNLVNGPANFIWESLSWSPEGMKLAFTSDDAGMDNYYDVYAVNADGSGLTNMSDAAHGGGGGWSSSWSPDGGQVAYGDFSIYAVNRDGSGRTRLTNAPDLHPTWSPDGSRIAFERYLGTGNWEIYVMNADGSAQTRLTDAADEDTRPAWSPDGSKIVFVRRTECRGPDGDFLPWPDSASCSSVFVMNADGTAPTRLAVGYGRPSWSPDGSSVAFMSYRNGSDQLITINPDGSGEATLTHATPNDPVTWFAWSPDSTKLVYELSSSIYLLDANGERQTFLTIGGSPEWQALVPSGFRNARKFCQAQREAQGKGAFKERYRRPAFRNCVRQAGG